jgi:hypothetical protein
MALKFYAPVELADTSAGLTLDGDLVIDTTLLVADTTNGKIGIGTASPSQLFQVSASGTNPYIRVNEYAYTGLDIGQENGNGNGIINLRDSAALRIFTNATERMRISADGQVGIGETNVDARLHIASTSGSGIVNQKFESNGSAAWRLGIPASQTYFAFDNSADALTSPRMVIDSAGEVGIGTTAPYHALDIYSNSNVPLRVHRPSNANLNSSGAWGIGFSTRGDAVTSTTDTRAGIFSYYNGNLFLATGTSSIISDPDAYARLTITGAGNVGIGTTTPTSSKLNINSNGSSDSVVRIDAADARGASRYALQIIDSDTNSRGSLYVSTSSGPSAILTGGNVLIGTTTDSGERLYVNGNTRVGGNLYVASDIIHTGDTDTKIQFNTDIINFDTAGVERLRITAGGNVGIGTASPAYKLDVTGELRATSVLRANSNAIVGGYLDLTGDFFHRDDIKVLNKAANNWLIWAQRDTAASEVVVDLNYIGTITPGSDSAYDIGTNTVRFANGYFDTLYGDGSNLTGITATETDTLDSVTSRGSTTSNAIGVGGLNVDSGTLYVDTTNNRVGIGTTGPASTLMVHSTGSTAVSKQWQTIISDNNTLAADRGGGIIFRGRYSGTTPANFCGIRAGKLNSTNGDANAYLSLLYGAAGTMTEGVRINYNGNVLIGTTTDSGYKLEVDGDVNASGDYYAGGTQGYTGTVTIQQPSPQPPINIDIQGGIITNVY